MKKDSFYFPHDYNAANDVKCLFLRQQLGMEGYGIFWCLVERLADAGGHLPLKIIPVLAMQMQVPEVKVSAVIQNFELFEIATEHFYSNRLNEHLNLRKSFIEKGREGALKRWNNSPPISDPNSPPISDPNAKERKGKEINTESDVAKQNAPPNSPPNSPPIGSFAEPDKPATAPLPGLKTEAEPEPPPQAPPPKNSLAEKQNQCLQREDKFYQEIKPFVQSYAPEMLRKFYDHWREKNKSKTQMRFEQQKTWDLNLRLRKWERDEPTFTKTEKNNNPLKSTTDEYLQQRKKIEERSRQLANGTN